MILGGGIIRSGGNTKIIMIIDIVGTWCDRIAYSGTQLFVWRNFCYDLLLFTGLFKRNIQRYNFGTKALLPLASVLGKMAGINGIWWSFLISETLTVVLAIIYLGIAEKKELIICNDRNMEDEIS